MFANPGCFCQLPFVVASLQFANLAESCKINIQETRIKHGGWKPLLLYSSINEILQKEIGRGTQIMTTFVSSTCLR